MTLVKNNILSADDEFNLFLITEFTTFSNRYPIYYDMSMNTHI